MVLVFRINSGRETYAAPHRCQDYATHLIEHLRVKKIPLPESDAQFRDRVQIYFEERRARQNTYSDRMEVEALLRAAGFEIEQLVSIVSPMAADFVQLKSNLHRFLAIAKASDSSEV